MPNTPQIVLLDFSNDQTGTLCHRLEMQGYSVIAAKDAAEGARIALGEPPAVVVADLWMKGISGVQLCRLLGAEPATENVPVILRGPDSPRNRFWAERAGAAAYVVTGRMGDLVRALANAVASNQGGTGFFTTFPHGGEDIRERIAAHLDAALFESVLASEVRALGTCGEFDRLFDLLSQFVSRVIPYRWMALSRGNPHRVGLHANPATMRAARAEAAHALGVNADTAMVCVEDHDASEDGSGQPIIVRPIELGGLAIGTMALCPRPDDSQENDRFVSVIARELAGPIRMATLVEESHRLATVDALTGLLNRRAFSQQLDVEIARSNRHGHPLSLILLDVDRFKAVNDQRGHQAGDLVLAGVGRQLAGGGRRADICARWGGEEFVIALTDTDDCGSMVVAERLRAELESMVVNDPHGVPIPVTASFGVALLQKDDTLATLVHRADQAMYAAKSGGRNRCVLSQQPAPGPGCVTLAQQTAAA